MTAVKSPPFREVDSPDPSTSFYLFHGPDEGRSRTYADRLLKGLAADKQVVASEDLKGDPSRLADAARAISLFGDKQLIWIEPAREEMAEAARILLDTATVESPTVAIAGKLPKSSTLLKLAEAHPNALAHASYPLEGRQAERAIEEIGVNEGLRLDPGVSARVVEAAANDIRVATQELVKFALFLGAAPDSPKRLDHDTLDRVGAELSGDWQRIVDLALGGDLRGVSEELGRLPGGGAESIPLIRALQRRLLMLAPLRAKVERGQRPHDVMASAGKALFWRDKEKVGKMLGLWDAKAIGRMMERSGDAERAIMTGAPSAEVLGEELLSIARQARRRLG